MDKLVVSHINSDSSNNSESESDSEKRVTSDGEEVNGDLSMSAADTSIVKSEPDDESDENLTGLDSSAYQSDQNCAQDSDVKPIKTETERDVKDIKPELVKSKTNMTKAQLRRRELEKQQRDKLCRVWPDAATDRQHEMMLRRLATQGVVQLFNAVAERQKSIRDETENAGKSAFKKDIAKYKLMSDGTAFERKIGKHALPNPDHDEDDSKTDVKKLTPETKSELPPVVNGAEIQIDD